MIVSSLLLLKFGSDIVARLIRDAYFRSLGILVLIMAAVGTLFFWLVEGRTFLQALAYAVATLAMNSPYGLSMGPATPGGIVFNIVYVFLGVGVFLIFVLEAGKTMVKSHEEFSRKRTERRALKRVKKEAAIAEGQRASFTVDALDGARLTGHVERVSPAAGSEFSVLRPHNATANFVKVPQRTGVRIRIGPGQPPAARLRPGMSVEAAVDTQS